MRLTYLAALTLVVANVGAAEPAAPPSRSDVRLLIGVTPNYEVTETAKPSGGGASSEYTWEGGKRMAMAVGAQYLIEIDQPRPTGRPVIGVEMLLSGGTVEPDTYSSNGAALANADGEQFTYVAANPSLILGWRFAQPEGSKIGVIGEIQTVLGVSVLSGRIENAYGSDISIGYGANAGVRFLLGLQEAGWVGTVSVGAHRGVAAITMEQGTYTSDLELDSIGAEVLISAGYHF